MPDYVSYEGLVDGMNTYTYEMINAPFFSFVNVEQITSYNVCN